MSSRVMSPVANKNEDLDPVVLPEYILCPTGTGTLVRGLLFHVHKAGTSSATLPLRLLIVEGEHSGVVYGKMTQLKDQLGFVGTAWMKIIFERNQNMCLEDARTRLQMNPNLLLPLSKNLAKPLPSGLDPSKLLVDPKEFSLNPVDRLSPDDLTAFLARVEPFCGGPPLRKKDVFTSIVAGSRKRIARQFFLHDGGELGEAEEGKEEEGEAGKEPPSTPKADKKEDKRPRPTPTPPRDKRPPPTPSAEKRPTPTPVEKRPTPIPVEKRPTPTTPREKEEPKSSVKKVKEEVKLSPKVSALIPRKLSYPSVKPPPVARCAVCWCENSDPLTQCTKCLHSVHTSCYGNPLIRLTEEEQKEWMCESCKSGDTELECVLCLSKNWLPMKRTVDSRWGHMLCACYTPQVSFVYPVGREPIQNRLVRHSKCFICLKANGACVTCYTCSKHFHLTCVLRKHNPFVRQSAAGVKAEVQGKMLLNDMMIVFNCGTH